MAWNFADMWESVSDALADNVVLVQGDRRVTWRPVRRARGRASPPRFTAAGLAARLEGRVVPLQLQRVQRGVYATFKMRGVPVNVNYRYLEDELAYLLDNSDAEALLFHGELGEHVAKVRDQAPT